MTDRALRDHLLELLRGGSAHAPVLETLESYPIRLRDQTLSGVPHTPWRLLEHMRLAQWDILAFSRDARHVSPPFPEGYWPQEETCPGEDAWTRSLAAFGADLQALQDLVADPATDLFTPIAHGEGQTILREALLTADHNAYHLGQLIAIRRGLENPGDAGSRVAPSPVL